MTIDRAEWDKLRQRRRLEKPTGLLLQAAQAGEAIGQMMEDPTWRAYQGMLTKHIEDTQKTADAALNRSVWANYGDEAERHRRDYYYSMGMLEGLRWALALPREILERGEAAVEELSKRNGHAGTDTPAA